MTITPTLELEKSLWREGVQVIAGVDEVGRGPLAGPVVAAAVVFDPYFILDGVRDSKALSAKKRERLAELIRRTALAVGVGQVEPEEIDRINIRRAALKAMRLAVENLGLEPEMVLVDGRDVPDWPYPARAVVKGDQTVFTIAAASIVAKVFRDSIMEKYDPIFPAYHFASNKGYGTREHLEALRRFGPSEIHRKSFHWK
jgi:ribonuclease HII